MEGNERKYTPMTRLVKTSAGYLVGIVPGFLLTEFAFGMSTGNSIILCLVIWMMNSSFEAIKIFYYKS